MRVVEKQERVMGRFHVRTNAMDGRVPPDEVWVRRGESSVAGADLEARNPDDACLGCAFFTLGRYGMGKCGKHHDVRTIDDTCDDFRPKTAPMYMLLVQDNPAKWPPPRKHPKSPGGFQWFLEGKRVWYESEGKRKTSKDAPWGSETQPKWFATANEEKVRDYLTDLQKRMPWSKWRAMLLEGNYFVKYAYPR